MPHDTTQHTHAHTHTATTQGCIGSSDGSDGDGIGSGTVSKIQAGGFINTTLVKKSVILSPLSPRSLSLPLRVYMCICIALLLNPVYDATVLY
ncbi:hypothetical protein DOY81_005196 [Sarcophaga bullata]|nr:hypothetical protein DOY81_005196 [Sarcophaga bullata]